MKIYLDSDMISAKGKGDMPPEEQVALEAIYRAGDAGQCELCTSEVAAEEIGPYLGESKPAIERIYHVTPKVPYTERQTLLGIHSYGDRYTWINSPMIEDNPDWLRVRELGLKDKDAHHVMLANRGGCHVLLTRDGGLLHRAGAIQQRYGLRVMKPSALCAETGWT